MIGCESRCDFRVGAKITAAQSTIFSHKLMKKKCNAGDHHRNSMLAMNSTQWHRGPVGPSRHSRRLTRIDTRDESSLSSSGGMECTHNKHYTGLCGITRIVLLLTIVTLGGVWVTLSGLPTAFPTELPMKTRASWTSSWDGSPTTET